MTPDLLTPNQLRFPEHLPPAEVVQRIKQVLAQSDESLLQDPRLDWENFIHRVCWLYKVHPFMPLIALQREQSLLADNNEAATDRAWSRAAGVVGQHVPGTANALWDGLPNQLMLSVRVTAWLAGFGTAESFGANSRLWPTVPRWTGEAKVLNLLNPDGSFCRKHVCQDEMEYAELAYTPDARVNANGVLKVRAVNWEVFSKYVNPAWEA